MATPARRSLFTFLKYGAAAAAAGSLALHLCTREARFDPGFGPRSDPALFDYAWASRINPAGKKGTYDSCVMEVPFSRVRPDLLEDALAGGSRLVEQLAAGVWGRYAFAPQRKILEKLRRDGSNEDDLWDSERLLKSTYEDGTIIADDFIALEKKPRSILFRGGLSPRDRLDGPREIDSLIMLTAEPSPDRGVVEFKLKMILVNGLAPNGGTLPPPAVFLHMVYSKLLLTAAVAHCSS